MLLANRFERPISGLSIICVLLPRATCAQSATACASSRSHARHSNTWWVAFFACVSCRSATQVSASLTRLRALSARASRQRHTAARSPTPVRLTAAALHRATAQATWLTLSSHKDEADDRVIYLVALALDVLAAAMLAFALNHQRKHRSPGAQLLLSPRVQRSDSAAAHSDNKPPLWRRIDAVQALTCALALLCSVALVLNAIAGKEAAPDVRYWVFAGLFAAQRLPNVAMVLTTVFARASADGPTRRSKALFGVACVAYLPSMVVPLLYPLIPRWVFCALLPRVADRALTRAVASSSTHDHCTFYAGSVLDLVNTLYTLALILFFFFCRAEFLRNMEECIWTTVSQIQDSFSFQFNANRF